MNRIILIGNGFDLAHGLKTSYKDFIDWYWREWGKKLYQGKSKLEEDELCRFKLNDGVELAAWYLVWHYYYHRNPSSEPWDESEVVAIAKQDSQLCSFTIKSPLFRELYRSYETKGWVDIENEYYKFLCRAGMTHDAAKAANDDMDFIKLKLIEYLKFIQEEASKLLVLDNKLVNKIINHFELRDISLEGLSRLARPRLNGKAIYYDTETSDARLMSLNFNYTDIADRYLPSSNVHRIVHIHGELSKPDSVIFGYGDELDEGYRILSKKNENEYLRNIKSIRYLESDCYRKILEFIESAPFQIYIMGHSCGNSDRTLLNTLFEHKNCVSIKPYYYVNENGVDNYLELVQNISRNFTDMKLMRDRVVNKKFCEPMM